MIEGALHIGDIHALAATGILPPNFKDTNGITHQPNSKQAYVYDEFVGCLDRVLSSGLPVDKIISIGDNIEGEQRKSDRRTTLSFPIEDQINAAILILEQVRQRFPKAVWRFVPGTPYHESLESVRTIAREFTDVLPTDLSFFYSVGDAIVNVHHEIAATSALNTLGALEREVIRMKLAEQKGWPHCHVISRGHRHFDDKVEKGDTLIFVNPCLKLQDEYGTKKTPFLVPDLGFSHVLVNDSILKTEYGIPPATCRYFKFKHPIPVF